MDWLNREIGLGHLEVIVLIICISAYFVIKLIRKERPDEILGKLGELKEKGVLTQEEFDEKKKELLEKL
jgi:hypothetical protein